MIAQKGYTDEELPTAETIGSRMNELGYYSKTVEKSRPKKIPETDAIFDQLKVYHDEAAQDPTTPDIAIELLEFPYPLSL